MKLCVSIGDYGETREILIPLRNMHSKTICQQLLHVLNELDNPFEMHATDPIILAAFGLMKEMEDEQILITERKRFFFVKLYDYILGSRFVHVHVSIEDS